MPRIRTLRRSSAPRPCRPASARVHSALCCPSARLARLLPATFPRLPVSREARDPPNIRTGSAGPVEAAGAEGAALLPPEPPAPPTDFQRFVASSIGEILPIFGASLFERVPTTFAPLDRVPVTADYVVGPGDQILLRAWGQVNLDLELTVDAPAPSSFPRPAT